MIDRHITRRTLLLAGCASGALIAACGQNGADGTSARRAEPFPLHRVRLQPSRWLASVETNLRYLLSLEPDRLLHNFRKGAGLEPKAERYGGWESMSIAGHTLGHYLSACSLTHAQTGNEECARRARYIAAELAECQKTQGDGYIGGATVTRDGREIDAKIIFEEVRSGEIRSSGFDLNGAWVPLYAFHKIFAGLLDAHLHAGGGEALDVASAAAGYFADIFEALNNEQLQSVLATEFGGLNESFAELHARTGDPRWLSIATRLHHKKALDPLLEGRDELAGLHANTQIPKIIGMARLHELTGDSGLAEGARFFWETVTGRHSYAIGGNSEREHFGPPGLLSSRLSDQTCEACNSYNMLKLTRHLFSWRPDARYFDYYERAHLNHILSQQHPETGMFSYFTPMLAGAARRYSSPTEDFWCCLGSGIESHAKHGDSIWWRSGEALYVNLFIPSTLEWEERGMTLDIDTDYPDAETVTLAVRRAGAKGATPIHIRIPGWCAAPALAVNDEPVAIDKQAGYAVIERRWREGDRIDLALPMTLRAEPTPDRPDMVAFMHGPLVLAADLGAADESYLKPPPALVAADPLAALAPSGEGPHRFVSGAAGRPDALAFDAFYAQYDRRTAVYLPVFTDAAWRSEKERFESEGQARRALEARTVDVLHIGEMQPERDHGLQERSTALTYYMGRNGRNIWGGGSLEFTLAMRPGPLSLQIVEWAETHNRPLQITVDGDVFDAPPIRAGTGKEFASIDIALPEDLTRGKTRIAVRIAPGEDNWLSVFEARIVSREE